MHKHSPVVPPRTAITEEGTAVMDGWDMTGWAWFWMSLMMVVGIAALALLVVLLARGAQSAEHRPEQDDALATLRRRFASGEIDEDEFRRRRAELEY